MTTPTIASTATCGSRRTARIGQSKARVKTAVPLIGGKPEDGAPRRAVHRRFYRFRLSDELLPEKDLPERRAHELAELFFRRIVHEDHAGHDFLRVLDRRHDAGKHRKFAFLGGRLLSFGRADVVDVELRGVRPRRL